VPQRTLFSYARTLGCLVPSSGSAFCDPRDFGQGELSAGYERTPRPRADP
jgi:hypothetical protein